MSSLKQWCFLEGKSLLYFSFSIFLAICALWSSFSFSQSPIKFLIGPICLILAYRYFVLSVKISGSIFGSVKVNDSANQTSRVVNLQSGTYNKSLHVKGDYIAGNQYINNIFRDLTFDQNIAQSLQDIQKAVNDLIEKTGDTSFSQQKAIDDLTELLGVNKQFKNKLNLYLDSNGLPSSNIEHEIAEKILEIMRLDLREPFWKKYISAEGKKKKYAKLEYLLRAAQWCDADEETVLLIKKLMPNRTRIHGCTEISINEISNMELKTINQMWLEASGGRFGFSVQQRIWRKIQILQSSPNSKFYGYDPYDLFVEMVGWSNDRGCIYHSDFTYQITDMHGSLPAKILLLETYDPNSKYCTLSACLFDKLMERNYSKYSLLPNWLRRWLLLE